jgi:hypothetical protein
MIWYRAGFYHVDRNRECVGLQDFADDNLRGRLRCSLNEWLIDSGPHDRDIMVNFEHVFCKRETRKRKKSRAVTKVSDNYCSW